jgi:hypothetical protein
LLAENRICNSFIHSYIFTISYAEPAGRQRSQESMVVLQSQLVQFRAAGGDAASPLFQRRSVFAKYISAPYDRETKCKKCQKQTTENAFSHHKPSPYLLDGKPVVFRFDFNRMVPGIMNKKVQNFQFSLLEMHVQSQNDRDNQQAGYAAKIGNPECGRSI